MQEARELNSKIRQTRFHFSNVLDSKVFLFLDNVPGEKQAKAHTITTQAKTILDVMI
jgi:hypothetical protein